ncbi:MAG: Eco57I restriction-modification methylase domain-containing protein, partial [Fervidobacterium sp.]
YRVLRKPEYDITLHSRVQEYFEKVEKLSLKTELAKENFFETFKLGVDSIFGKLVIDLMRLFDWVYPRSKFLNGAYGFWRRSFAREPEKIPDSWRPFLKGDGDVFKFMFCLESAHALLARLILAKACEDLKFPGIGISNFVVQKIHQFRGQIPVVGYPIVLLRLLKEMKDQLVYSIFEEDIFSWWSDAFVSLSEKSSGELLQEKVDDELESFSETIARLLFILYKYDFSEVAGDPLGDLYQQYFDKETRKALGEFYTPVEVVNYILDAVEYKYVRHKRLLDPACGSGTFLVEALKRYLKEMEPVAKEKGWAFVLRELCNSPRIVGFDIHPFACLIAQVRFMLELMPYYKKAIEEEKIMVQTSLQRLPIFRTDSLLIELEPSENQRSPRLLVTEENLQFMVSLPIKVNSEEAVAAKVMIPTWQRTSVGTRYNLFNLDEYFCVTQAIFDEVKAMVKIDATEVPIKGLAAHIRKYLSNKDFDVIAEFFKLYADHILSEIKRLQKEFEDGRLVKSIEDAVLSALLKNYVKYDFVVGNPPYVRVQKLPKEVRNYYHNKYASARGKFDIYLLFIERGIMWLEKAGRLG